MGAKRPPHVRLGRFVRRFLRQVGLARPARPPPSARAQRRAVFDRVIAAYRALPDPAESFEGWCRAARVAELEGPEQVFRADARRLLADLDVAVSSDADADGLGVALRRAVQEPMTEARRRDVLGRYLTCVREPTVTPRFYEYDLLHDLDEILSGRYACGRPDLATRVTLAAEVIDALAGRQEGEPRDTAIRRLLGTDHAALEHPVGEPHPGFREVVGEDAAAFADVRVEADPDAFLAGNRAYSYKRREQLGHADTREISLLREYEQDHLAMLRAILRLQKSGELTADDEVLIVGSRYRDEIAFFREDLGLPRTTGLDLFDDSGWIVAGDMHAMPFDDGRFKLVYTCNTLSYSHYARTAVEEMARVTTRPGYVFIVDSGTRPNGPTPLARTDMVSAEAVRRMFHRHRFTTLVCDDGRSLDVSVYANQPCVAVRLDAEA